MKKISKFLLTSLMIAQTVSVVPLNTYAETIKQVDKEREGAASSQESTSTSSQESSDNSETSTATSDSSSTGTDSSSIESEETITTSDSSSTESSSTTSSQTGSNVPTSSEENTTETTISQIPTNSSGHSKESNNQDNVNGRYQNTDDSSLVTQKVNTELNDIHFEKDESVESFIRKIGESARKIGANKGLYSSVMIAQAILESSSGQSQLAQAPNYNLFGIKGAYRGNSVLMNTQEDHGNGALYSIQAKFKKYDNYEESFNDYADLMKEGISGDKNFYAGTWKSNTRTYKEATSFLTGKYATDIQYHKKLNELIETYDLTQYDKKIQEISVNTKGYQVPLNNYYISSPFGNRNGDFHRGIDLAATQGEPIHAAKRGIVIEAAFHSSWGNYVVIQHEDGFFTLYAHQQQYEVSVGEEVAQGETIGYVGSTGNSTGPHLHLEISRDKSLNQQSLLDPNLIIFNDK